MIKEIVKCMVSKIGYFVPYKSKLDADESRKILQDYSPRPIGSCYTTNNVNIEYDLQIIVPVYNVEKYIVQCIKSVFAQKSKYKTLVTVVNDGSTDSTGLILKNIFSEISSGEQQMNLNIINQSNKGVSGSRNAALKNIKGKYIMFLDSDDVLPENTITKMMNCAVKTNADIVQGSWFDFSNSSKEEHIVEDNSRKISGYPWGKLYKYTVLEHFQFPEGYWFEDTPISFILAAMPLNIVSIKDMVYGYRLNLEGITSKAVKSKKSVDSYWITEQCLEEFTKFNLEYNQRAYEYLLNQSLMNAGRTRYQSEMVNEAQFVLMSCLIENYFPQYYTSNRKMLLVEKALKNRSYRQFNFFIRAF